jgi:glycosyltransferase involved in cell wall biosynthesis
MDSPYKLLVFMSYLGSGGAEKHTVRLVNSLNPDNFDITIVTPNKAGLYEKEVLPHIKILKIGSRKAFQWSASLARLTCLRHLRKLLYKLKPDLVMTVTDIHTLIYLLAVKKMKNRPKHIALVQNALSESYGKSKKLVEKIIYKSIPSWYMKIDKIVALSQGVAQDLERLSHALKNKVVVINNIGVDQELRSKASPISLPDRRPIILACGRLVAQKGYPHLIQAFAQLILKIPATLIILGDGELKQEVLQLIEYYQLQDNVKLLGFQENPYSYMASADLFVLSSIYEGFGNVIVEAMACNAPVVSTDCPHGPNEIIQHGVNGMLVPVRNPEALAKAMSEVLSNSDLQDTLRKNGLKRSEEFEASKISSQYEKLFQDILLA